MLLAGEARGQGVTRDELAGPSWRSPFTGVHHDAALEQDPLLLARCAARLLPPGGAVDRRWAATVHGADVLARDERTVQLVVPDDVRPLRIRGTTCRTADLPEQDLCVVDGVPVTSVVRTCCDVARHEPLVEAVVVLDALVTLYAFVTAPLLGRELRRWYGRRGTRRAREVLGLVRRGPESPMESRLRLLLVLAGLPVPVVQHEVRDRGRLVARVDLAYPELRLVVEYDGGVHDDPRVNARDTARVTELEALGWTVLRFRAVDVYGRPARVVALVRAALAQAELAAAA